MDMQLQGKTALVSGAERGTGAVIAQALAAEGVVVAVHGNSQAGAEAGAAAITNGVAIWGDLSDSCGCQQVLQQCAQQLGAIDILVNNLGSASPGKWGQTSEADWLQMYQLNVLSGVRLAEAFIPAMKTKSWGRIVNLGTIGSHQPGRRMPHYYAAKGALATLTVSLAQELSGSGITVNTVAPGLIHTPELEAAYRQQAQRRGWGDDWETIVKHIVAGDFPNPVGRIAQRQEVADLVVYLCSPRADFIHGQNIRIDGGAVAYV